MTEEQATTQLSAMLASDSDPILSDDEVYQLVVSARRADTFGRAPSDTSWVPTYNLNSAAADGWRWKAGKAAKRFDVSDRRSVANYSDVFKQCMAMSREYKAQGTGSARVTGTTLGRYRAGVQDRGDWIGQGEIIIP